MTHLKPYADLLARLLLAAIFISAGINKIGDVQGFAGYMSSGGVPAFLAWPVILLEIIGGIAVLIGYKTRLAALALAGFSLSAALLYHYVPGDQMQMILFMKNLGLTGGFLILAVHGAGSLSLDAKSNQNVVAA